MHVLAEQCTRLFLDHNTEPDVIDLLVESEIINEITRLVDENTYGHVYGISVNDSVCISYVYLSSTYYLSDV
jgi:hypothetical protein